MILYKSFLLIAAAVLLSGLNGCGNSTTASGSVTFDGRPIANGQITFVPEDRKGPVVGGLITEGRYRVDKLTPGRKIVQIIGVKKINFAQSHEEMAAAAKNAAKLGDSSGIIERADIIPPGAEGNNSVVEIVSGDQTFDFSIKALEGK
jgi:hypothetical protein